MSIIKTSRFTGTYRGALNALVAAAGTAPFFILSSAANKKIKLKRIRISGLTLTAVAYLSLVVSKYSTAPTGGTPAVMTKVPMDSAYDASAATLAQGYTAAPTAGTLVGDIASERVIGQATVAAAAGIPQIIDINFPADSEEPVIKTAAENFGLRFSAAPATAVTLNIDIEWEEESI